MKKTILYFIFLLYSILPAGALEDFTCETSIYPDFYFPGKEKTFSLWANPALLVNNESFRFHVTLTTGLCASLSRLYSVLKGDYALIAYWVDQLSEAGYGAGLGIDIGGEWKNWGAGVNIFLDAYAKGPAGVTLPGYPTMPGFPAISYGNCTLTTCLYGGLGYPLIINDFTLHLGMTFFPLFRLKVPMTTEFYTMIISNIIDWDQDSLRTLFKDCSLYAGVGAGMNATVMFEYKNCDIFLLLDNVFHTYIFYYEHELGRVADNPGELFSGEHSSYDHIGIIPMELSVICLQTIKTNSRFIQGIELGYGYNHFLDFRTGVSSAFLDFLYVKEQLNFFSFSSLYFSLYKGSFQWGVSFFFPHFSIDVNTVKALRDDALYPGPNTATVLSIHVDY
jgi:hypothetical protein